MLTWLHDINFKQQDVTVNTVAQHLQFKEKNKIITITIIIIVICISRV